VDLVGLVDARWHYLAAAAFSSRRVGQFSKAARQRQRRGPIAGLQSQGYLYLGREGGALPLVSEISNGNCHRMADSRGIDMLGMALS
jgi:hypothetical protein